MSACDDDDFSGELAKPLELHETPLTISVAKCSPSLLSESDSFADASDMSACNDDGFSGELAQTLEMGLKHERPLTISAANRSGDDGGLSSSLNRSPSMIGPKCSCDDDAPSASERSRSGDDDDAPCISASESLGDDGGLAIASSHRAFLAKMMVPWKKITPLGA